MIKSEKAVDSMIEFQRNDVSMSILSSIFEQYVMSDDYSEFGLTSREGQCLFYLIRGKTAKEIGIMFSISKRTVEKHIEQIKDKLNCRTKSCLIEKSIKLGFVNILPSGFLKNFLIDF